MKYLPYLIAIISGATAVFAFSPFDYWWIAYLSVTGLLWLISTQNKKIALRGAFLWGISFFSVGVNWLNVSIHQFGGAPLFISYFLVLLLAAYLALYPLLFAYLAIRLRAQRATLLASLWLLTEFLRGWVFTGFPWLKLGYSQIDSPFTAIAPVFGVNGLDFFVVWVSATLLHFLLALIRQKPQFIAALVHFSLLITVSGFAHLAVTQHYVQPQAEKSLNISLLQGNIEQNLKWDPDYLYQTLSIYQKLISAQLENKSDLIILPEAALPTLENHIQPFLQSLQQAAQTQGSEVIIGTIYHDNAQNKLLNSIIVLGNPMSPYQTENPNRYNKAHLVPFGEYVPLETLLRPLGSVFNLPMSDFQSGTNVQAPLQAKQHHFTPAICYEIIFGDQLQQNLRADTDFILTISNDAWFGNSIGPWQHLQMARMRALELGKPVIRATNTGISVFINEFGKILAQAPQFETTSLTYKLTPTTGNTPYAVLGDKPLYALGCLFTLLHLLGCLLARLLPALRKH